MNPISATETQAMIPAEASRILGDKNVSFNQLDNFPRSQKCMEEILCRLVWGNITNVKALPDR